MRILPDKRRANVLLGLLLMLTLGFIWGNSMLPREDSAAISMGLWQSICALLGVESSNDIPLRKLAHFAEFWLLGTELAGLFFLNRGRELRSAAFAMLLSLAAAAVDETIQIFSHRGAMVKDVLLDYAGAMTGIMLLLRLTGQMLRRKEKQENAREKRNHG